jgi:hypothetical protein
MDTQNDSNQDGFPPKKLKGTSCIKWKIKINNEITDKTLVPDDPKNNMRFKICKPFCSYHKEGLGQQLRFLEISNNVLKNKQNFFHCSILKM